MAFDTVTPRNLPAPQRARGDAMLSAAVRDAHSVIRDLRQSGATKLLFPRARDAALDAVFLNTSGGITGGDDFKLTARATAGSHLRLTSQAAERIYRAVPETSGHVRTELAADAGAKLEWLPQETILFEGAALKRSLRFDLASDARLLACETLVFGRAAMGEVVRDLRLRDRIDVHRDGALIWADRLRLEGDAQAVLDQRFVAGGAGALATVIYAAPDAGAQLRHLRAQLPVGGGASLVQPDLVILRLLAEDGFALRAHLVAILRHLGGAALPRPWMI